MKWYYSIQGGHTHVRVFMNGAKCGDLCFRNGEFEKLKQQIDRINPFTEHNPYIVFIKDVVFDPFPQ